MKQPATCVRWRPETSDQNIKHSMMSTYAGGKCLFWHVTSQKILARYTEEHNDLNTCGFTFDGKKFITAGSDTKVRLYDIGRKNCSVFTKGSCSEHSNRIFASKFANENLLLTVIYKLILLRMLFEFGGCNLCYYKKGWMGLECIDVGFENAIYLGIHLWSFNMRRCT